MFPVVFTVPGRLLALSAPALVLAGLLTMALALRRRSARDLGTYAVAAIVLGITVAVRFAPRAAGVSTWRAVVTRAAWTGHWPSLPIEAPGAALALSFALAWVYTLRRAQRAGLPREQAAEALVVCTVAALAGARIVYALSDLDAFRDEHTGHVAWDALVGLRHGGLSALGALLGATAGSAWYFVRARRAGRDAFWTWCDALAPSGLLAVVIGRVGCYLYGCEFGAPLAARAPAWLARLGRFPRWADETGAPAWVAHVRQGFAVEIARCAGELHGEMRDGLCHLEPSAAASAPVHPVQLYEALAALLLYGAIIVLARRKRFDGQSFLLAAGSYALLRLAAEPARGDAAHGPTLVAAVLVLLAVAVGYRVRWRQVRAATA